MAAERSILFCFAHPDDESFTVAGTAARYLSEGVRCLLACATRGEAGKMGDPPVCTREELPRVREQELREACRIIGLPEPVLLGYRDRELADAPGDEIRRKLVALIRQHRPQIVITFDPEGANRHPDHIAISRFTTDAVAAAADPRFYPEAGPPHRVQRLLWTIPVSVWLDLRAGREPFSCPGVDYVIDIRPWRARKADALRAHRSQHLSIDRFFFHLSPEERERALSIEAFRHGCGTPPPPGATDLFAGL
ncbi:MAG: PIG-L deacetylase family protein [Bacillota bacterium]